MTTNPLRNPRAFATVLAALRYWQREGLFSDGAEQDIATDGGIPPMSADEIDVLCEELNQQDTPTRIVIELEGGLIQQVYAATPIEYLVYDRDVEGVPEDDIADRPSVTDDGQTTKVFRSGYYGAEVVPASNIEAAFKAVDEDEGGSDE